MAGLHSADVDHLLSFTQEQPDSVPRLLEDSVGARVQRLQGQTLPLNLQEDVAESSRDV